MAGLLGPSPNLISLLAFAAGVMRHGRDYYAGGPKSELGQDRTDAWQYVVESSGAYSPWGKKSARFVVPPTITRLYRGESRPMLAQSVLGASRIATKQLATRKLRRGWNGGLVPRNIMSPSAVGLGPRVRGLGPGAWGSGSTGMR